MIYVKKKKNTEKAIQEYVHLKKYIVSRKIMCNKALMSYLSIR